MEKLFPGFLGTLGQFLGTLGQFLGTLGQFLGTLEKLFPSFLGTLGRFLGTLEKLFPGFLGTLGQFLATLAWNHAYKKVSLPIIAKFDPRPIFQRPLDTGPQAPIGKKPLGCEGNQYRVSYHGVAGPDLFNRETVWKMPGTNNLHPVFKDKNSHGCINQVIPMNQGID